MASVAPCDFTEEYRETVCKIGQGAECCRYLTVGGEGWVCAKKTSMQYAIDLRGDKMAAKGDNCDGCFEPQPAFVLLKECGGNPAGTVVYHAKGYDYGLASDDTRMTGIPHTSMTLDPSGDYPTFTVADRDFVPTEQVPA